MKKKSLLGLLALAAASASMGDVTLPSTSTIADIQAAIDSAQAGDVITLADGTYAFDTPLYVTNAVTLTGSGRDNCILLGNDSTPFSTATALILNHADARVEKLTVSNITSTAWYNNYGVGVQILAGRLAKARVTGCKTTGGNRAGGVSIEGSSKNVAFMSDCMIDHNTAKAANDVGGVLFQKNGGTMVNCLVWANEGNAAGGVGVMNPSAWAPIKIVNCTIAGNKATTRAGGVNLAVNAYASVNDGPWIVNSIVAGNEAPEGADFVFSSDKARDLTGYNCLCGSMVYGENYQNRDPGFVSVDTGDFHLAANSAARNKGDKAKAESVLGYSLDGTTDFYGLDRVLEDVIEIGCAEFEPAPDELICSIEMDTDVAFAGEAMSLSAFTSGFGEDVEDVVYAWTIQREGDDESVTKSGKVITFSSDLQGAYTVNLTVSSVQLGKSATAESATFFIRSKTVYVTSQANPGAAYPYGDPETAATSLVVAMQAVVEGMTVVLDEGTHNVEEPISITKGIAVRGAGRDKTTINATKACKTLIAINGEGALLQGVTITNVRMNEDWNQNPAAVSIGGDGGTLADCRVTDCASTGLRVFGTVKISGSNALVTRCLIDGNAIASSQSACGGIYATAGRIENCVITNNVSAMSSAYGTHKGAGLNLAGAVIVLNCTVMDNRMASGHDGAGVYVESDSARVHNCIIDGNLNGDEDETESNYLGAGACYSYCLSSQQAAQGSKNCIVGRPVFSSTKKLCLAKGSPGRSMGSVAGYEDRLMTATDFFGNPRVKNVSHKGDQDIVDIDIGATESKYSPSGLIVVLR